ncbi:ArnT family glycosyltransferase [Lysobacter panacisoli]|uniref:Glycosyltransferase RgtA/B/C/D-like domain-containing protein n=1 Tax=Lysobacter panacisoli TaxID=1255263 RepID=A0ABP9L1B6_9GAMM|nr:glycosyltransferase family 39 protein [Lysobacter panacisoli]
MPAVVRSPALWIAVLAATLGFVFLGARGIWDPDEGRYTNVALNMLASGDWLTPHRSHEVGHWTKPPLTYWAIAASLWTFGPHPWSARLPAALAYLLCVGFAFRAAARLSPGSERVAALAYATMLLPVGASQFITTDFVLAACMNLAMWAFIEARFGPQAHAGRWLTLMWGGLALAFIAKGPPGLIVLPVMLLFDALHPDRRGSSALQWTGIALFVVLALPWYLAVFHGNPGLFAYFVGDEVVRRVLTDEFGRHGEWYGWIQIYVPTLLVGTLPWTPALLRWTRGLPAQVRAWIHDPVQRANDASWLLLSLWLLLPLLVFCFARSRLPLYLLPLFVAMAVIVAMQRQREGRSPPRWRWLLAWAALLLAMKLVAAVWPTHKDASEWARAIRARAPGTISEVVFVEDMARYGLHLYLGTGTQIEKISLSAFDQPRFNPPYDEPLAVELAEGEKNVVWICRQSQWPQVEARIVTAGYRVRRLGSPYRERVMFVVEPSK